jgi:hypothetical protein
MLKPKQIDNYRTELSGQVDRAALDLEEKYKQLNSERLKLEAKKKRLNLTLPHPNACVLCFYEHGITSLIRSIPSDSKEDRFRCEQGHDFQE